MSKKHPHEDSHVARFLRRRVLEMQPKKSQAEIAAEVGFPHANMINLIKTGRTKLPFDRVPAMARALEWDPKHLFLMALHQEGEQGTLAAMEEVYGPSFTMNEAAWIAALREACDLSDPPVTTRDRHKLSAIFK